MNTDADPLHDGEVNTHPHDLLRFGSFPYSTSCMMRDPFSLESAMPLSQDEPIDPTNGPHAPKQMDRLAKNPSLRPRPTDSSIRMNLSSSTSASTSTSVTLSKAVNGSLNVQDLNSSVISGSANSNANLNTNTNTNGNANLNLSANANTNTNTNTNANPSQSANLTATSATTSTSVSGSMPSTIATSATSAIAAIAATSNEPVNIDDPETWDRDTLLAWCISSQRLLSMEDAARLTHETFRHRSDGPIFHGHHPMSFHHQIQDHGDIHDQSPFLGRAASCPGSLEAFHDDTPAYEYTAAPTTTVPIPVPHPSGHHWMDDQPPAHPQRAQQQLQYQQQIQHQHQQQSQQHHHQQQQQHHQNQQQHHQNQQHQQQYQHQHNHNHMAPPHTQIASHNVAGIHADQLNTAHRQGHPSNQSHSHSQLNPQHHQQHLQNTQHHNPYPHHAYQSQGQCQHPANTNQHHLPIPSQSAHQSQQQGQFAPSSWGSLSSSPYGARSIPTPSSSLSGSLPHGSQLPQESPPAYYVEGTTRFPRARSFHSLQSAHSRFSRAQRGPYTLDRVQGSPVFPAPIPSSWLSAAQEGKKEIPVMDTQFMLDPLAQNGHHDASLSSSAPSAITRSFRTKHQSSTGCSSIHTDQTLQPADTHSPPGSTSFPHGLGVVPHTMKSHLIGSSTDSLAVENVMAKPLKAAFHQVNAHLRPSSNFDGIVTVESDSMGEKPSAIHPSLAQEDPTLAQPTRHSVLYEKTTTAGSHPQTLHTAQSAGEYPVTTILSALSTAFDNIAIQNHLSMERREHHDSVMAETCNSHLGLMIPSVPIHTASTANNTGLSSSLPSTLPSSASKRHIFHEVTPGVRAENTGPKVCGGCGQEKKRVFRYLGAENPVCNACNQHWRRHTHDCPLCMRLYRLGANVTYRGVDQPAIRPMYGSSPSSKGKRPMGRRSSYQELASLSMGHDSKSTIYETADNSTYRHDENSSLSSDNDELLGELE
eukprot:TRINITY_DN6863_c0_g1_i2.p1 TRINITY_DN6863_c0_g1~~TRINITY_DN6863_c0_g1_i2.p1  ORF type:complete len:983 (-),score=177.41 TRINITY_DN6863_c0_g1_i2:639-3587(-)